VPTIRFVVRGWVQGVGFRDFVARLAEGLAISGEVWNRPDGCVEAVAHHEDRQVLDQFAEQLWKGPGRVEDVHSTSSSEEYPMRSFRITFRQ